MVSDGILMELAELSRSLGARHFSNAARSGFSSVSIDSRTVQEGSLFVALTGTSSDGHCFVEAAFRSGATAALVDSSKLENSNLINAAKSMGKDLIAVDNTLRALQDTARIYLEQFPTLTKIGITGSSGKTTTKEIASAIISAEKKTVMNPGNYNSETGLPLAVFEVRSVHEAGVFELGMNRKGEIAELAEVLKPNIALITNIGSAHVGNIGSIRSIAEEKKNIFSQFSGKETALIPEHDEFRDFLSEDVSGKVRFYGAGCFEELGEIKNLGLQGSEIVWAGERIRFVLPGKHNLANALAALAIAREIKVSPQAVKQGLESVRPLFGRGEILRGRTTVIRDCYNANPESLQQILDFCDNLEWQGRRIYVIGELLELGDAALAAHEQVGRLLAASRADRVFLYGMETEVTAAVLERAVRDTQIAEAKFFFHTNDIHELSRTLDGYIQGGEMVLLKGSRGCALEQLSDMLTGEKC